ncbi:MAG TPA: AMP-binding protein, partial [Acidimicrobiales bacterium]|nr:AMP-binding protein [Acidimicrobiales bacterium]
HRTAFWALMEQHQVTWINAVPAIVSHLADPDPGEDVPSRIRFNRSASAPLPAATLSRFEDNTGIPVLETYGMTEAASQITANPLMGPRKPGSVGVPVGVELRITVDETVAPQETRSPDESPQEIRSPDESPQETRSLDETTSPDEATSAGETAPIAETECMQAGIGGSPRDGSQPGHVEIRGPSVITAYGGNRHRDRFTADGWLRTGDLGTLDDDGYLYLVGRTDDVINRGGEKVYPRDIEEAILTDPDVMAAAVVAEDDAVLGQVPVAFLVLQIGVDASDTGTVGFIANRVRKGLDATLVRSQQPVAIHVVEELPAGATGKVQRRALRHERPPIRFSLECR